MMVKKPRFFFGLKFKLMLFATVLAMITYSVSEFFIFVIYDYVKEQISEGVFVTLVMLLGVVWSGILAYSAGGFIVKPLRKLEEAVRKAAQGDIQEDVPLPKMEDEVRSLSHAFNMMLASLREMVRNIDTNFTETNEKVEQICLRTSEVAQQAKGVSATLHEISGGAEQSAAAIQAISGTVSETVNLAGRAEEQARHSDQLASQMVQALGQSTKVFTSLIQGIHSLAEENAQSMQSVRRLEEHTKQVGNIVELVSTIASQTNLLALNASIEAARAGEHGRGFAVVAEEVRKLADESAHSAQSISSLLSSMQTEVQIVVERMSAQVKTANDEAKRGEATELLLKDMSVSVTDVAQGVAKISEYMKQQIQHIHETGAQVREISAIAEESAAGAQHVAYATVQQTEHIELVEGLTRELQQKAADLKKTIEQFHV
ncbi:methyl-accepting chemotaxis protein [Ectobacillus sp. JY-23]|uniref:methyl-accepting chemotaxis protein n=1 Tax=Ectobacillus sp. JY-23 TaxID=2933872 RepID=UPI001FF57312|nr:methyl-accepting chemotaxis protein [Ectobacillus sp. JY-23]UOY91656.1 methyl-accepting chemotaxis protein [Ectobacillus sp. JY-23]